jgi:hypothetical protein
VLRCGACRAARINPQILDEHRHLGETPPLTRTRQARRRQPTSAARLGSRALLDGGEEVHDHGDVAQRLWRRRSECRHQSDQLPSGATSNPGQSPVSASRVSGRGRYRANVRRATCRPDANKFLLFVHYDNATAALGSVCWLVPASEFCALLSRQKLTRPTYVFNSTFGAKADMWAPFRLHLKNSASSILAMLD